MLEEAIGLFHLLLECIGVARQSVLDGVLPCEPGLVVVRAVVAVAIVAEDTLRKAVKARGTT